jgi:membrane-anchored protein YejM (alkaline phosphatase superfamily)
MHLKKPSGYLSSVPNFGLFVALSWLHMLTVTWAYYREGNPVSGLNLLTAFHLSAWSIYSLLYLLPGLLPALLVCRFVKPKSRIVATLSVIGTSLCILFIRSDSVIYDLYRFHFNGFVVNLLMTPGGVQSLGGGGDTYLSIAISSLSHILVQLCLWPLSIWLAARKHLPIRWRLALAVLASLMIGERVVYGMADIRNDGNILNASKVYPFYGRTTFRTAAMKFGIEPARRADKMAVELNGGRLNYPIGKIEYAPVARPPNVVILVAESLRWDRMTREIMPNTWRLAQKSQHFTHHYSSGNGTREGLFGLFYGLYGSYWSNFLYAQRSPLLMDRMQELGYQFDIRTSAKFSYPEFDKTLFAKIPVDALHESKGSMPPWEHDQQNTTALIDFLKQRDTTRPFMSFFFIESTHARYTFPDSAIIAKPYLESVNYGAMSRESLTPNIDQLLNRYTNAAHWIDVQMGRIYAELERQGLLDDTIVIVTGDHGEEFMEKGAWGHNSDFVDEQIRTPMVMWMPRREPRVINDVSSHLDIGTTLLQLLGAPKDAGNYSLGTNLFEIADRLFVVSSDWHSISVITKDMKYRIPYANRGTDNWSPTDMKDAPYSGDAITEMLKKNNPIVLDAIKNCSKFTAR